MSKPNDNPQKPYIIGFTLCLVLTLVAFILTDRKLLQHRVLVATIGLLALTQFMVQIVFFLHLGTDTKPRWKQAAFYFMLLVVGIVIIGSIWIMNNLNYNMMTPQQINQYIKGQDGL